MELDIVDQLLICLAHQPRNVPMTMRALGYIQEQISEAWTAARTAYYIESTRIVLPPPGGFARCIYEQVRVPLQQPAGRTIRGKC